ncbi:CaiB/BaiF CoA-transferase family protein [Siccirubricoccus sp. G192]|uniref:CaiB/BaiF CoA transferase family protein n=1 Tax=Siccirubricoccus sp. G192 TaxID=2849651 RepID=UPI001C2C9122|nr:CoA transferase [Siccirubricoccus sp. G192]MBV1797628.1 CoA transferase [Siccirubricoccus sp. G192]
MGRLLPVAAASPCCAEAALLDVPGRSNQLRAGTSSCRRTLCTWRGLPTGQTASTLGSAGPIAARLHEGARMPEGALDGILVVDFTRVIAGPLCTQILGDLGAEVVKIEHPHGGDDTRAFAPVADGESAFFLAYNRNKQSVALDLSVPAGAEIARALMGRADVVVENFSTGVMERLGLDLQAARRASPRLITCSISGYGRTGPVADRPGYDPVVQAESGIMSVNGFPDREPIRSGLPMVDIMTGLTAGNAILAALMARERSGKGQHVEVALFDTGVAMTTHLAMGYLVAGVEPQRVGNAGIATEPVGVFHAADGAFQMTISGERAWRKLACDALGRPELLDAPDFATNLARLANREALHARLNAIFGTESRQAWMARLRAAAVPAGLVRSIGEAMASEEVKGRQLVGTAPHARLGTVANLRSPMHLSGTPVGEPAGAPTLGEHTAAVLETVLGLSSAEIAALAAAGAVRGSAA